jgi:3-deoxy-D-manno-octulosonate 8-phosphate phosphatase (KDO 8-P phosphatase)
MEPEFMIKWAFFDIDGVLTDGMVYVDAEGKEIKRISFDDIDAIFELKRSGIRIGFITGESNNFSKYVQGRFEPDVFIAGEKDKLSAFRRVEEEYHIDRMQVCYVGDSKKDIDLLLYVYYGFCPSNVNSGVKKATRFVLNAKRGEGVIREVTDFIIKQRGECGSEATGS